MTYRTQFFLVLVLLGLVCTGLFATASYRVCDLLLRREVHRKVHSVASTAVLLLDPATVAQLAATGESAKAAHDQVLKTLLAVRTANRRVDIRTDRLWILLPDPTDPRRVMYAIDTGTDTSPPYPAGEAYQIDGQPVLTGLQGIHLRDSEVSNFQVSYDTGFAPIYDRSGKLVGELGVKLGWAPNTQLGNVWRFMLPPVVATLLVATVMAVLLARGVTRNLQRLRAAVDAIGKGELDTSLEPGGAVEFADLARAVNEMTTGLRERKTIREAFSGYLSPEVLDMIVRAGKRPELKGERKEISVLFADLRNFTQLSEVTRPEEVVTLLSTIFEKMVAVVHHNDGRVDKFLGDGLMATFGAPVDDSNHREHAILTAMEIQEELQQLCLQWRAEGRRNDLKMGIGIHSGSAVVGNIGSQVHMEYTAIGDTVNLASRLQDATKDVGCDILVSEATYRSVQARFGFKSIGGIQVKGRSQPVQVYGVNDMKKN